jgi:hypothetical protein
MGKVAYRLNPKLIAESQPKESAAKAFVKIKGLKVGF